ncbi:MAG TPA: divalent-cation tolerance protein CutA [Terracidiphilus sp.]|nr:divalent-cation tolerance protein CutA [Terracidiphilus sp.]
MIESATTARIVLTTAESREEALGIGRALVEERLAACATVIPAAQSIYRWEDKVESAAETLLLLKTEADRLEELDARLHALHSYTTPEFLVLRVDAGSRAYLDWLRTCLG